MDEGIPIIILDSDDSCDMEIFEDITSPLKKVRRLNDVKDDQPEDWSDVEIIEQIKEEVAITNDNEGEPKIIDRSIVGENSQQEIRKVSEESLRLEFLVRFKKSFDQMTRQDLEELTLQKIIEAISCQEDFSVLKLILESHQRIIAKNKQTIKKLNLQLYQLFLVHSQLENSIDEKNLQDLQDISSERLKDNLFAVDKASSPNRMRHSRSLDVTTKLSSIGDDRIEVLADNASTLELDNKVEFFDFKLLESECGASFTDNCSPVIRFNKPSSFFLTPPQPYVPPEPLKLQFLSDYENTVHQLTKNDLEELVLQKIAEALLNQKELLDLRRLIEKQEEIVALHRSKILFLRQMLRHVVMVHSRILQNFSEYKRQCDEATNETGEQKLQFWYSKKGSQKDQGLFADPISPMELCDLPTKCLFESNEYPSISGLIKTDADK